MPSLVSVSHKRAKFDKGCPLRDLGAARRLPVSPSCISVVQIAAAMHQYSTHQSFTSVALRAAWSESFAQTLP